MVELSYEFELPYEPVDGASLDEAKLADLSDVLQTAVCRFRSATYHLLQKNEQGLQGPAILTKLRNEYNLDALPLYTALNTLTIDRLMNQPVMRGHFQLVSIDYAGKPKRVWKAVPTFESRTAVEENVEPITNAVDVLGCSEDVSARGGHGGSSAGTPAGAFSASLLVATNDNDDRTLVENSAASQLDHGRRFVTTINALDDNDMYPPVRGGFACRGGGNGITATVAEPAHALSAVSQDDKNDSANALWSMGLILGRRGRGRAAVAVCSAGSGRGGVSAAGPPGVTAATQAVHGASDDTDTAPNVYDTNSAASQVDSGRRFVTATIARDDDDNDFPPVRGGFARRGGGNGSRVPATNAIFGGIRGRGRGRGLSAVAALPSRPGA